MKELRLEYSWPTPKTVSDPLERLVDFYAANGYDIRDSDYGPADGAQESEMTEPDGGRKQDGEVMVRASLRRGKPGEGWWASDMTDLGVVAELTLASDRVEAILVVDVRGQLLSSGDRAFWQSEAKSASAYLSGVSEIVDCRMAEVLRGQSVSRSIRSTARWSGALVFIGLSILGFFAVRTFPEVAQVFEAIRDMLF